jgi:archaetidylinositol phosphate synthase
MTMKPYDQRLANLLVTPLKNTPVHPNHLTTLTLILGQAAAWTFAFAIDLAWLAALLYILAVFSDHMDGELARMTGKTSAFGHDYDYIVGGINYTTLFIGIGIGLQEHGMWTLILGFAAGLSNPFILYLRMRMEIDHGTEAVEHPAFGGFEIEDFIYLIGPITWFAGILWFFVPYALGNVGYLIWTLTEYHRWKKQKQD